MTDPFLTAYGVTAAALRDDVEGLRTLLHGLSAEETAAVAEGSLLAMAEAVRMALPPSSVDDMVRAVQNLSLEDQENRT